MKARLGYYQMLTTKKYNEYLGGNIIKAECNICGKDTNNSIIIDTDGFSTIYRGGICNEECFSMWLIKEV
jgi:hypothetical protein